MKHLIFAVAMTSIALTACKKTKTVTVQEQAPTIAMDESTQVMMKVIVNGEEMEFSNLPIAEVIKGLDVEHLGGEVDVQVMVSGDESVYQSLKGCDLSDIIGIANNSGNGNMQFEAIADMIFEDEEGNVYSMSMNGHEPHAMHGKAFGWVDGGDLHGKHGHFEAHSGHHDKAIMMHKKMHMGNAHDMHNVNVWVGHGGDFEACEGEWVEQEDNCLEREHEEEFEFMHKVNLYHEVGNHLSESDAMAIFGVHMLRDNVEPETRMELLDGIIEATFDREPGRNAALLVAIETLMEQGEEEEAAWYMAELVISNSAHGHVPWEDEGHEHAGDDHGHAHGDGDGHDDDEGHEHDNDDDWDEHDHPHPHGDHDHDH